MIKIQKLPDVVKVYHPIKTLTFDRSQFDLISDHIYLIYSETPTGKKIIRQKGNIDELNYSNWFCIYHKFNAIYNDKTMRSVDVDYLIQEGII